MKPTLFASLGVALLLSTSATGVWAQAAAMPAASAASAPMTNKAGQPPAAMASAPASKKPAKSGAQGGPSASAPK